MENPSPIFIGLVSISSMAMVALIIWIASREKQSKINAQRDVQLALLEKFKSGEEMSRFLASEEGRQFVNQLAGLDGLVAQLSGSASADPRRKTVGLLVAGIVLLALGGGFYVLSASLSGMRIASVLFLALAVGLLLAAAAAHVVSKRLGLVPGSAGSGQSDRPRVD